MKDESYVKALNISREGEGRLEDAYNLLCIARDAGDRRADYAIATWMLSGNDVVAKDISKAVSVLKSLQDANIAEAVYDLAVSYDLGIGLRKNIKTAFSLYMKSGLLGSKLACDQVSQFYAEGRIVPYDKRLAKAWALRAEQAEKDISPVYRLWIA